MKQENVARSYGILVGKLSLFLFGAMIWFSLALFTIRYVKEESTDYYNSEAFIVNECDEYYYEKKYAELYEFLNLYKAYDEKYAVYWEVTNAYIDLQEYLKWKKVSKEEISNAREMEKLYKEKVINYAKNPAFPQNQKYLDNFVEMLDK